MTSSFRGFSAGIANRYVIVHVETVIKHFFSDNEIVSLDVTTR